MRSHPSPRVPGQKKRIHRRLLEQVRANLLTNPGLLALTLLLPGPALALDLTLTSGNATITQASTTTQIDQQSQRTIFESSHFNIATNELLRINGPNPSSSTLIRDIGNDPSSILGRIESNGQFFLVNPNGVLFGPHSQISVHGLLATTLDIRNEDFLAGNYRFYKANTVTTDGRVINQGTITATDSGYIVLAGDYVENSGLIEARLGEVALASGSRLTLDLAGDNLISLAVDEATLSSQAGVSNLGELKADGGKVLMTAKVANELIGTVVNNEGLIQARTIQEREGEIILLGGMEGGTVEVGGTLDASAPDGGDGGLIETSGHTVRVHDGATITTEAPQGETGSWLIDPFDYFISAIGGDISGAALSSALATTNVTIQSIAGLIHGQGDILVNDDISWSADTTLTLEALNTIQVNAAIDSLGAGGVTLESDSDADGSGTVSFGEGGSLATAYGPATIYYNPTSYATPTDFSPFYRTGALGRLAVPGSPWGLTAYMLVNNIDDLQAVNTNLNGSYALGRDIDASVTRTWNDGAGFDPLGGVTNQFTGAFDGRSHTISDLFINRPETWYVGLFGGCADGSSLRHLGLTNVDITGGFQTGGLAAHMGIGATVVGSYTTGKVRGLSNTVGGLVGLNAGLISHSYSLAEVNGVMFVGGLVGSNWGEIAHIKHSFSTGLVTGSSAVGGLVGINYNTGVDPVTDSYWDTESSGQTTSAGGTGKTTAEMHQQATYTNWDFVRTWRVYEGATNPLLKSFLTPITITADDATRPYGDRNPSFTATYSDGVDPSKLQGTFMPTTDATRTSPVGAYTLVPGGLSSLDYDIQYINGALTVTPRPLSLNGLIADDKVYDGTTAATIHGFGALSGIVANDVVTLDTAEFTAAFATKDVGLDKEVTLANLALSGADAMNYTIGDQITFADITPKSLHLIGLQADNKVYDGLTTATISNFGTLSGVVADDVVTLNSGNYLANFDSSEVGSNKTVTVKGLGLNGVEAGNYAIGDQRTVADITPAAPVAPTPPTLTTEAKKRQRETVDTATSVLTRNLASRTVIDPLETGRLAGDQQPDGSGENGGSEEPTVTLEESAQDNGLRQRPIFTLDNGGVAGQNMVCK